jgi:hypothetical protein
VPEDYFSSYTQAVTQYVEARKGVLSQRKYTEYARVVLALSALGQDARDVAGYDLTLPLGDYDKVLLQGVNGPIWALLALDARSYPMPQNSDAKTQATRQMYVDYILSCQLSDGGWALSGGAADPDLTGMALQALAKYRTQPAVAAAVEKALALISARQTANGAFDGWGTGGAEGTAQLLTALCELGISLENAADLPAGGRQLRPLGRRLRRQPDGHRAGPVRPGCGLAGRHRGRKPVPHGPAGRLSDAHEKTTQTAASASAGAGGGGTGPALAPERSGPAGDACRRHRPRRIGPG